MYLKAALPYLKNNHELLVSDSMDKQHSYEQFLTAVLETELIERDKNAVTRKIKAARFPYNKYLSDLKYDSFPLDVSNRVRELQSLSFIEKGQNIILVGNPGVGKTHIAIGLGTLACAQNKTVLFITVPNLITELKESLSMNQLTNYKKKFIGYDLVILDELGYISFDKQGSELLFNLLSLRNDSKSLIITTNLTFNRWQEIFNDPTLTAAMVDRLTHKAHVINIKGESYRLKETKEWLTGNWPNFKPSHWPNFKLTYAVIKAVKDTNFKGKKILTDYIKVGTISKIFNVSIEAATYRLEGLGIIEKDIVDIHNYTEAFVDLCS